MPETIADRADFSHLRYAQVWEDADVLCAALAIRSGDRVLSIASAGDNALALLAEGGADGPREVVAVDLSPAQLHALALRVAAFRTLDHDEILELIGSSPSARRASLYARLRPALGADARRFWDARPADLARGVGHAGRFERYFARFRRIVLPLTQTRARVATLLAGGGTPEGRRAWYDAHWANLRWRLLFRLAAGRAALGAARDPRFFVHVGADVPVAERIAARVREAVTATDPAENPYLNWILRGHHGAALPRYLRAEHFETIRSRLDRLTPHLGALEAVAGDGSFDAFNLSDVFEYLAPPDADALFATVARLAAPGARVAWWDLLAERHPPPGVPLAEDAALGARLHAADRAPFYRAFHVAVRT